MVSDFAETATIDQRTFSTLPPTARPWAAAWRASAALTSGVMSTVIVNGCSFQAMLQPCPDTTPPHPRRQGHAPHSSSNLLKTNRSSQQWHRSAATRMLSSS